MSDLSWIDDGYDQECIEPDATVNNEFAGVAASTSKSVCAGNESDQEDSDATEVSNKTVQTEQAAHRQQSCSSRASLDSQRSISFFVEFDDCDINANDTVFSGNIFKCAANFLNLIMLMFIYISVDKNLNCPFWR